MLPANRAGNFQEYGDLSIVYQQPAAKNSNSAP